MTTTIVTTPAGVLKPPPQPTLTPANAHETVKKYGGLVIEPVSSPDMGMVLGLFGPGGLGKTTVAATITHSRHAPRALLLNSRGNPHVIASYAGKIDIIQIGKYDNLEPVRKDLIADCMVNGVPKAELPYHSVIIDNATEIFYTRLRDMYGPVGDVDWQKHSATTADMLQMARNFMDLAEIAPRLNVIFVFQEVKEKRVVGGAEADVSEIAFNKALQSQLPTIISFLGRLYMAPTPSQPYRRMLDFRPVETTHQAKFQVDRQHPEVRKIPMQLYEPDLGALLDTVRYHEPFPVERFTRDGKAPTPQPLGGNAS